MNENMENQEIQPVEPTPVQRHRRSNRSVSDPSAHSDAPSAFSRVSSHVTPASGETRDAASQSSSRVRTPADEALRRPVAAPGYTRREPARAAAVGEEPLRSVKPVSDSVNEQGRAWPRIVILVVLLLVLLIFGLMLLPDDGGVLGTVKHAVTDPINRLLGRAPSATAVPAGEVIDINANPTQGTAPLSVIFSVTTRGAIDDISLVTADGTHLDNLALTQRQDNTDVVVWVLQADFRQAFSGDLSVAIQNQGQWTTTSRMVNLQIAAPAVLPSEGPASVVPADESGALELPVAPQILDLSLENNEGEIPLTSQFTLHTDAEAEDLRMVGSDGTIYTPSELSRATDEQGVLWFGRLQFDQPVDDLLTVELLWNGEWVNTFQELSIYAYPQEQEEPAEAAVTIAPTDIPPVPTQVPTVVTEDHIVAVTAVPVPDEHLEEQPVDESAEDTVAETEGIVSVDTADALHDSSVTSGPEAKSTDIAADMPSDEQTAPADDSAQSEQTATSDQAETQPEETEAPAARRLTVVADDQASPKLIKRIQRYNTSNKKTEEYVRDAKDAVDFPNAEEYNALAFGILTFRGSSFRQNASFGSAPEALTKMSVKWQTEADSVKGTGKTVYYGIGRNSQAAIVRWAKNVRVFTNMSDEKRDTQSLKEVIIGGEDGKIYFLDLADGQPTRSAINLGYPMRSAPSLDPFGNAFMAIGQYARKMASGTGKIGMRYYNLLDQKQLGMIDGTDSKLKRPISELSSFDTSPIIDRNSNTMISVGSNGLLYVTKLNIEQSRTEASLKFNPSTVVLRTQADGEAKNRTAVSSSPAAYQNYVFYADRGGILRCVDVNTLSVLWAVDTGDAVEAAVALDLDEDENLWLYTATTLQNRNKGDAVMRCYNAETGALRWELPVNVTKTKSGNPIAGVYASPVIGTGLLKDSVFFTISSVSAAGGKTLFGESTAKDGVLVCVDKQSGAVKWTYELDSYAYSSPVAVYGANDIGAWIVQASAEGTLYLLNAQDGSLVSTLGLDGTVLGSPAVYSTNNSTTLVIGTQGKGESYIYGISLE